MGLLYSQDTYNLVGSNTTDLGSDCYRLTTTVGINQEGAAWNETQIDLSCDFNWSGTINVGLEGGADGMAFMFQNTGINQAAAASLNGIPGITSLAVEFDSYENNNICNNPPTQGDPCGGCVGDHVAVYRNANHILPLVSAKCVPSFADGNDHNLDIAWKHSTNILTVMIDNVLVVTYSRDIVNTIFGGNSMVYYGFVARTGSLTNEHSFCHTSSSNDNCCPADNGFSN